MDEKEKELLLHLLEKANEEGLLNVYDCEENYHEVEWMFLDKGEIYFKVNLEYGKERQGFMQDM